ncbi:MarR family transcriptional regulator [Mycobacterium tuberculosis]|nr:MarR family transcriptional regulator [Mycobacterium tuberculosis]
MNSEPPAPRDRVQDFRVALHERLLREGLVEPNSVDRFDIVFNLTRFFNRLGQDSESLQRRLGWSWAGFRIMNLLWVTGPLESRHLGRLAGASRATISSVLSTLERDGLVERTRSDSDRRQVLVQLTDTGHTRLKEGLRLQARLDADWLSVLTTDEQVQLNALLQRLADQRAPQDRPPFVAY